MAIKAYWDTEIKGNHGWLFDLPGLSRVLPAPHLSDLRRNASVRSIAKAVQATARYEGIELPERFEVDIER